MPTAGTEVAEVHPVNPKDTVLKASFPCGVSTSTHARDLSLILLEETSGCLPFTAWYFTKEVFCWMGGQMNCLPSRKRK